MMGFVAIDRIFFLFDLGLCCELGLKFDVRATFDLYLFYSM